MSSLVEFSAHIRDPAEMMSLAARPAKTRPDDDQVLEEIRALGARLPEALEPVLQMAADARAFIERIEAGEPGILDGIDDDFVDALLAKERSYDAIRHALAADQQHRIDSIQRGGAHRALVRLLRRDRRLVDRTLIALLNALRDLRWAIMIARAAQRPSMTTVEITSGEEWDAFFASIASDE